MMWAREPDTVAGNWARARRDYQTAISHLSLRTGSLLPLLGNSAMTDSLGMRVAILTVVMLLRAGVYSANIQYDTMRKTQTWYGNAFDAGREYTCDTVVELDQKKQYLSSSHTFGKWYLVQSIPEGSTSSNGHDMHAERSTDLCHGTGNVQASGVGLEVRAEHSAEGGSRGRSVFHAPWVWFGSKGGRGATGESGGLAHLLDRD